MKRLRSETKLIAKASGYQNPRSPTRVMQLLYELATMSAGAPLARLAERLALPKTSVLSILRTLSEAGYVENLGGIYRLGHEALKLGAAISTSTRFPPSIREALVRLAERTSETAMIAVLVKQDTAATYVDVIESQNSIRFAAIVGARRPLYCTAVGKLLLAYQSKEEQASYLKKEKFIRYLPNTPVERSAIQRQLAQIRKDRFAVSVEEFIEGAAAIAAPILDSSGVVMAGLTVAAPASRLMRCQRRLIEEVVAAGHEMSHLLGFTGRRQKAES